MSNKKNKVILWLFILILIGFEIYALSVDNQFKYDSVLMLILLIFVYYLKDKIDLHPLHFFLFGIFLVMHNLGAFGAYANTYFGFTFDNYIHGFFGVVAGLIVYRFYDKKTKLTGLLLILTVIGLIMGISAVHEVVEYIGAITLGTGEGVLFIGAGDHSTFDTQNDMLNNLIGALIAIISIRIFKKK